MRADRFLKATKPTRVTSSKESDEQAKAALAAAELKAYEEDKLGQRSWTAAASALGAVATFASYGREVSCLRLPVKAHHGHHGLCAACRCASATLWGRWVAGCTCAYWGAVWMAWGAVRVLATLCLAMP